MPLVSCDPSEKGRQAMTDAVTYSCSICAESSTRICCWCTKDACENHLCTRCGRCSDCCACEVPLEPSHPVYTGDGQPGQ